ncbi:hypothetical protein MOF32_30295 [Priestia megaterium]|uniref:hypothetical protein n=1 Tax=Priestia megaterium TaxID=1404 RepID=UPI002281CDB7|nr:hypothetical protein [Priestia megaterium]MCY9027164.1 hypothetical protein [Priestia megaterium]
MLFIIDDILEEMAIEGKRYFSPHYIISIAKQSGQILTLKETTNHLLSLVGSNKKLQVFYEVECPNGDNDFPISSPLELSNEERTCHLCHVEYIPSPDRVWVYFDFTPAYKNYLKKKSLVPEQPQILALV